MNLGKQFGNTKHNNTGILWYHVGHLLALLGVLYLTNMLWNFVAPIWGLPSLTYVQFTATVLLVNIFTTLLGFRATQRDVHPNVELLKFIGEHSNEQK